MYRGYVFICNTQSLRDCLKSKTFACSKGTAEDVHEMETGSTVFFFNSISDELTGPFTATKATGIGLEPGAWSERTNDRSLSLNFNVEWEQLHVLKNAQEKFPFLRNMTACGISNFKTQELLNALEDSPPI
jgi:hypothetical protein